MVSVRQWDEALGSLEKQGRSGRLPKNADQQKINDETARALSSLTEAVRTLIRHVRQGPDWEKIHDVSYKDRDVNRQVTIRHDLGYVPNRLICVGQVSEIEPITSANNWGTWRIISANDKTMTVQISFQTDVRLATFYMIPFRSGFIPPAAGTPEGDIFAFGGESEEGLSQAPQQGNVNFSGTTPSP